MARLLKAIRSSSRLIEIKLRNNKATELELELQTTMVKPDDYGDSYVVSCYEAQVDLEVK